MSAQINEEELSDVGNADRFVSRFRHRWLFVSQRKAWYYYSDHDNRWIVDEHGQVIQAAIEVTRDIVAEAATVMIQAARAAGSNETKELAAVSSSLSRHALASQRKPRLEAMVSIASTSEYMHARLSDLDANPMLMAVKNGVVDLKSGQLVPGAPEQLITRSAATEYLPGGEEEAEHPIWSKFLERVQPDPDVRGWLQRWAGYCLTGLNIEQMFAIFYGTGANGKTVFTETISEMLGDYATSTPFATFSESLKNELLRNDLAALCGRRLVVSAEGAQGGRLDESAIKQITGGDRLSARFLYCEPFTFSPQCKVVLFSNHKPVIKGTDHGIWRRVVLVPWDVTIPDADQDPDLRAKLRAEWPSILAWCLKGLSDYQQVGLALPPVLKSAREEYRQDSDLLGQWLDEGCVVGADRWDTSANLYASYSAWADENGYRAMSEKSLRDRLRERGFQPEKRNNARGWSGIAVRSWSAAASGTMTTDGGFAPGVVDDIEVPF